MENLSPAHQFLAEVYKTIEEYFQEQIDGGVGLADLTLRSKLANLVIFEFGAEQLRNAIADELRHNNNPQTRIAAAPELLEACQFFITALETSLLVRDISKDGQSDWALKMMNFAKQLQKAQAALAKAEPS